MTRRRFLLTTSLLFLAAASADMCRAQDGGVSRGATGGAITFTKEFPGSVPPYYSITLRQHSDASYTAEYRIEPGEEPTEIKVSTENGARAFSLAEQLGWFAGPPIESGKKVAQMGRKTLRYEGRSQPPAEAVFNHTERPEAVELTGWFEKLSMTQQHVDRIDYLLRFDKLGIVKELLQTEMDLNNNRLLEPALLLPALNKVLANKSLVNVAHDRASQIKSRITQ